VEDTPYVAEERRLEVLRLGKGFHEITLRYGFFETPDVPKALEGARALGLPLDLDSTTFFLGRETLVASANPHLKSWRVALYTWLASHALAPARFYALPPNRVVELGTQIAI
jgi:KUP system potassium uptake protein